MILKIFLSLLPVVFLIHLFSSEYLFHKKGINMDGKPPINKYLFFGSKYALLLIWTGMILEIWNIRIPGNFDFSKVLKIIGELLWLAGFLFLYTGRFSLGPNFRIGVANEKTEFIAKGIYRVSRNPMYVGLYLTLTGCILYSMNIFYSIVAIVIIAVHHKITLAEERQLVNTFGETYTGYCKKVRRYL